jgi:hypothetical protein
VPKDLDQRLLSTAFLLVHTCDVDENLVGNEEPIKSRLPEQSSSGRAVQLKENWKLMWYTSDLDRATDDST